jgi:hypothetical protein
VADCARLRAPGARWSGSSFGWPARAPRRPDVGGTLAGWALVETLHHRVRDWVSVALVALSLVIVLTLGWELGEYAGDRLFDTALIPSKRDSAEDILFGPAGGLVGITFSGFVAFWRRGG